MRKLPFFITITLLFLFTNMCLANEVRKQGVIYKVEKDNSVTAFIMSTADGIVSIKESIKIGKSTYTVKQIGKNLFGYGKNNSVEAIILPNSISIIKEKAFRGCRKLEHIVFPNGPYTIEQDAFKDCENIVTIEGNVGPFLDYARRSNLVFQGCKKASLFSAFAKEKLKSRMELWQTKKDYETAEQYKQRVTEENRKKRMEEFVEELKEEYVSFYAPTQITTAIGNYDSEYGVYTIQTVDYGKIFALVPKADAANFQGNYNKVEVIPKFGVVADTLSLTSCQFKLDGKTYVNATNYANKGGADYAFELPPFDVNQALTIEKGKAIQTAIADAVDKNIPKTKQNNDKTFALIIGNEHYKRASAVPFANNDARVFAEYCKNTLGLPSKNVKMYLDAGLNDMRHAVTTLVNTMKAYDGEARAIVYYAGHGMPDEL